MLKSILTVSAFAVMASSAFGAVSTVLDDMAAVTAVSHPSGAGVDGTWYDITNDAFSSALVGVMPVGGSACVVMDDGGFTNGAYIIYGAAATATDTFTVSCDMDIIEDSGNSNGIQAYEMGVQVNGVHRAANPSDLVNTFNATGEYTGTLDTGDNSANAPVVVTTAVFAATSGDDILVAFCTNLDTNFDSAAGTWGTSQVFIDNITLNAQTVPVELSVFSAE